MFGGVSSHHRPARNVLGDDSPRRNDTSFSNRNTGAYECTRANPRFRLNRNRLDEQRKRRGLVVVRRGA